LNSRLAIATTDVQLPKFINERKTVRRIRF
jgi:hypothetical protein